MTRPIMKAFCSKCGIEIELPKAPSLSLLLRDDASSPAPGPDGGMYCTRCKAEKAGIGTQLASVTGGAGVAAQQASTTAPSTVAHCPYCREEIRPDAVKCKHCGEFLAPVLRQQRAERSHSNPGVAAVLSFFIPGLGQLYNGQIGKALGIFILTVVGLIMFVVPGIVIWLINIVEAYNTASSKATV